MSLKLAVYGSLRAGMGNNRLIAHSKLLSNEKVSLPFEMIDMGAFPGLIKSNELNDIDVEIYEVDMPTYQRVERLEGYPSFYDRQLIETSVGAADIYFLHKSYNEWANKVRKTNGSYDWVKYLNKSEKINDKDSVEEE